MNTRLKMLAALTALSLTTATGAFAAPGGNGNGNGNGAANGNGGNAANAGTQSRGHGAETSAAAKDPATRGIEKAIAVVGTTPAAQQAKDALQSVLDKVLGREE